MLDAYSLVEGVVSPITPLTTFSDDSPATGEFVSIDDLRPFFYGGKWTSSVIFQMSDNTLVTNTITNHTSNENQTATDLLKKERPVPSIYPSKVGHWEG
jgi:hypothetical protein